MSLIASNHHLPSRAEIAVLDDRPYREVRNGLIAAGAFFVLFLGWAAFARLDAAASMGGQVAVAGHRQTLQHRDGGTVGAIHVKEGQHVNTGDVLIELTGADVQANEAALASQAISLEALRNRLAAEQGGQASVPRPVEWTGLTSEEEALADAALVAQQKQLQVRLSSSENQKNILRERQAQLKSQIWGYAQQVDATNQQHKLLEDQLAGAQKLAQQGYAGANTIRTLQRNEADLNGSKGQYAANEAASQQQIGETQFQIQQVDRQRLEDVAGQYRDVMFQLSDLEPKLLAAKEQLAQTVIRAPVSGTVVGLSVFSAGAVIAPGQKLMDIVPDQAPLIIDAQVQPSDAEDLSVGQIAEIKFQAFSQRDLPIFKGQITQISADSFVDEKTGGKFYTAEVSIPVSELNQLKRYNTEGQGLKPGLPVQVIVPLRKRTALQYLLEPLSEAVWRSFRER